MIENIKKWLLTPSGKTIIFVLSVIVSGILSGSFVTQITIEGKLVWKLFYKTLSFYLVVLYIIALYFYNKYIYVQEKDVMEFH